MLTNYEIDKIAESLKKKIGFRDEILNVSQICEKLELSEKAVRARCTRGQLPCHKKHGRLYFSLNEITEYLLTDE